ncbi:MAG: hypothetical protein KC477_00115 [Oceanospirillaceae bacterium]|nr:hypothetical protein [Oceanospirillaceae bacterium]
MSEDKHNTSKLSNIIAIVVSALFAAVAIAGYQRTNDIKQLMLFMALAVVAFGVVKLLFVGINKLLDSIGDDRP